MITVLSTDREVEAIGPEWDELWKQTPAATPFQSPRWMLPWWHHFGTGLPRVAIGRREGVLAGVLPLYTLPGERKALPMGAGTTDYIDILGNPTGLLDAALWKVGADRIVSCDLIDVQANSTMIHGLVSGWCGTWQESVSCPVLALPTLPKLARRNLTMSRNRADRRGGWRVESANLDTVHFHLDCLVRLHQSRWIGRGEPGVMADPRVRAFWREAAPGLLAAGLLRLSSLIVAGEIVAAVAALLAPGRIFFYLSGIDDAARFISPGTILIGAMLEQAAAENRSEAHFLRGRERYKYIWGAKDRFNWAATFVRDGPDQR